MKMCIFYTTKENLFFPPPPPPSPFFGKYSFRRNTINVVRANKQMDVFECHYLMYNDIISFMKNSAVWAALVKEKEEVGKKK